MSVEELPSPSASNLPLNSPPAARSKRKTATVAGLGMVFIALAVFTELPLLAEMAASETHVVRALRTDADLSVIVGPEFVGHVMMDMTSLGGYVLLILLCVSTIGYLRFQQDAQRNLVKYSVLGGYFLHLLLKGAFRRGRPDSVPHLVHAGMSSFPSGHAMMSAIVYFTLALIFSRRTSIAGLQKFYWTLAAIITLLVGTSRVFLGVHFPTDVVAGWCAGGIWVILCTTVWDKFASRKS